MKKQKPSHFIILKSLFQNDDSTDNFVTNTSSALSNNTHKDDKLATGNNFIINSAAENSFFPNNFDENGYVFDGVKIDVF